MFNKLLILRALRPEFPEALFFTTDFDEAFTIKSELPYTRNLIISSSFGPNLSDWLQGDIPFFRDTHETSAFLATQLAIGHLTQDLEAKNNLPADLSKQLLAPRLFEVKRNGKIFPFAWRLPSVPSRQTLDRKHEGNLLLANTSVVEGQSAMPCWKGNDSTNCGYIQPVDIEELQKLGHPDDPKVIEKPFPTYDDARRKTLAMELSVGAFLGLALLSLGKVPKSAHIEVWLVVVGLGVGALTSVFWDPIAQYLTENGAGEPFEQSVWPTVLLRFGGIILALYCMLRAQHSLQNNLARIAFEMHLDPPKPLWKQITRGFIAENLTKKIAHLFDFSRQSNGEGDQSHQSLDPLQVWALWRAYVDRERFWGRILRATFYTSLMYAFLRLVLIPLFGVGELAHPRGVLATGAYYAATRDEILLTLVFTFFVFDATLSCLLFVKKLRHGLTEWPPKTAEVYKERLSLQSVVVNDWIDLQFVAKRTGCIAKLIYYPLGIIALFILASNTVFTDYGPSLTILVTQGTSFTVVIGCAIVLWREAGASRTAAKENLTDAINYAKVEADCISVKDAPSNLAWRLCVTKFVSRPSWKPC